MVEIHLYGKLRGYAGGARPGQECVLKLAPRPGETLASLLQQAGIPAGEVNHIFLNAKLLASRSMAAPLYGFPQSQPTTDDWELATPLRDGDRVGLFGRDMAMLSM